jgi:hypothetical protein
MASANEHRRYAVSSTLLCPKPPQLSEDRGRLLHMVQASSELAEKPSPRATRLRSDAWRELAIQDADNDRARPARLGLRDGSK